MTGQVKEEILTRWGELGVFIENGTVSFNPIILEKSEIKADNTLNFTFCGVPVKYIFTKNNESSICVNGTKRKGTSLSVNESNDVFARNGKITAIQVEFAKNM